LRIGFNGRAGDHIKKLPKLRARALRPCVHADENVLNGGVAQFQQDGKKVEAFKDMRRLLESKEIDAVSIATPNHWHSLAAIWSFQDIVQTDVSRVNHFAGLDGPNGG